MYAIDEDDSENVEESTKNEEDLQAWCLLKEVKMSSDRRRSSDETSKERRKPIKHHC